MTSLHLVLEFVHTLTALSSTETHRQACLVAFLLTRAQPAANCLGKVPPATASGRRHNITTSWSVCVRWRHLNKCKTIEVSTVEVDYTTWSKILPILILPFLTYLWVHRSVTCFERPRDKRPKTCTYPCHTLMSWPVSGRETLALRNLYKIEIRLRRHYRGIIKTNVMTSGMMKEG